MFVIALKCII